MKRFFLILTILAFNTFHATAQSAEDSVKAAINNFFIGMQKSDTTLIRASLAPGAILQTIARKKDGMAVVRTEILDSFVVSIGRPRKEFLDERITFETIKIDADLALAWTPYQFYIDNKFSHCGVNSFQLVRVNGVWRIQYIIDTRRRSGCL